MSLDQLPSLALFEILSFLDFKEMIRLKAVCRRLNGLLTGYLTETRRRLFVHSEFISLKNKWARPDQEPIYLKLFLRCLTAGYFKNIKCLHLLFEKIIGPLPSYLDDSNRSDLLKCLAKLEELFITGYGVGRYLFHSETISPRDFEKNLIDLPDLKSLRINHLMADEVKINSQRLETLAVCNKIGRTTILSNPEKIRFIECRHFSEKAFQLDRFSGLEVLTCRYITANFDLQKYPKLKQLNIPKADPNTVNRLLRQKQILGRSNLEITCGAMIEFL